jgi:hypothetical protein
MALRIEEFFGHTPGDPRGLSNARAGICPFVQAPCIKPRHGACSLRAMQDSVPVICCPNRLYANDFEILNEVCEIAFGIGTTTMKPSDIRTSLSGGPLTGNEVAVFGKGWGGELPLPKATAGTGSYYVDWILARMNSAGKADELTALEIQTIDTTGNYGEQATAYFEGHLFVDAQGRTPGFSDAGFNWENVNKRILPQVIYKGHVLRREPRCTKGMFFACPTQVFQRISARLGGVGAMHDYEPGSGTITFLGYTLGPERSRNQLRTLIRTDQFTTTVDQVALAFTSPKNLPPSRVYEAAVNAALT